MFDYKQPIYLFSNSILKKIDYVSFDDLSERMYAHAVANNITRIKLYGAQSHAEVAKSNFIKYVNMNYHKNNIEIEVI